MCCLLLADPDKCQRECTCDVIAQFTMYDTTTNDKGNVGHQPTQTVENTVKR